MLNSDVLRTKNLEFDMWMRHVYYCENTPTQSATYGDASERLLCALYDPEEIIPHRRIARSCVTVQCW